MLDKFIIITKLVFSRANTLAHFCQTRDLRANSSPGKQHKVRWPGLNLIAYRNFFSLCVP